MDAKNEENPASGIIGEQDSLVPYKKLIDQNTLQQLLDDCREDEERRSIMYEMDTSAFSTERKDRDPELALAMIETQT